MSVGAPISRPSSGPRSAPRAASRWGIRFRVGTGVVEFDDVVRGHVTIDTRALGGDLVIMRSDATPIYHFTVCVDDTTMDITHVIRGEDHLQHAQARAAVPGAGRARAGVRAPAADPQPGPDEDVQAQVADRGGRVPDGGLHPRGVPELPGAAGLVVGRGEEDLFTLDELVEQFGLDPVPKLWRRVRPRALE